MIINFTTRRLNHQTMWPEYDVYLYFIITISTLAAVCRACQSEWRDIQHGNETFRLNFSAAWARNGEELFFNYRLTHFSRLAIDIMYHWFKVIVPNKLVYVCCVS